MKRKRAILTHEEIIGIGVGTADTEQFHEIMELAVYISAYRHWAFLWEQSDDQHTEHCTTGRIKTQASPEIGKAEGYIPLAERSTPLVVPLLPV